MRSLFRILTGIFLLITTSTAHSAIVYTDLGTGATPELTTDDSWGFINIYGDYTLDLPLDSDPGSARLGYDSFTWDGNTTILTYINSVTPVGEETGNYRLVYKLDKNTLVGPGSVWMKDGASLNMLYDEREPDNVDAYWENMGPDETGFLGFYFETGGNVHYGWAEIGVQADTGIPTLYGYAWEDVAGQTILTGAGAVPVPGSIGLLAAGLLGLAGIQRKKKQS